MSGVINKPTCGSENNTPLSFPSSRVSSFGMSQSPRADIIRSFVERWSNLDVDGIRELVTDDFWLEFEPKLSLVFFGLDDSGSGLKILAIAATKFNGVKVSLSLLHFELYLTVANP